MSYPATVRDEAGVISAHPTKLARIAQKLRVLQIGKFYPPHRGGIESHLEALCGELKQSIDVEIVVASSNGSEQSEEFFDGVKVSRLGKLFSLRSAPFCPQMVRRIRASKADIIHIHLPNPGAILAYIASGHGGRLVFTYHSDIVRQKILSRLFDPILRHGLNRADAIIVSSSNNIRSSYVLPRYEKQCRVIPYGIPVDRFQQPDDAEVARLRKKFGPRIVLGVGRLVYYKGFEHLIAAMKLVESRLVIIGCGPLCDSLRQQAIRCGVGERVIILTDVEDVSAYYHAADVFVLPSIARSEAFGIVQLEAMACGKPVVNTELNSGVTSVSLNGVTGVTVPPGDPEALGKAINSFLDNPVRCAAYGRAGRLRVSQHFSQQAMAQQTLALYYEVMDSPRHGKTSADKKGSSYQGGQALI